MRARPLALAAARARRTAASVDRVRWLYCRSRRRARRFAACVVRRPTERELREGTEGASAAGQHTHGARAMARRSLACKENARREEGHVHMDGHAGLQGVPQTCMSLHSPHARSPRSSATPTATSGNGDAADVSSIGAHTVKQKCSATPLSVSMLGAPHAKSPRPGALWSHLVTIGPPLCAAPARRGPIRRPGPARSGSQRYPPCATMFRGRDAENKRKLFFEV